MDLGSGLFGYLIVIYIVLDLLGKVFKFDPLIKLKEVISFGKSKKDDKSKLKNITDETPDDVINILEIDTVTGSAYFKEAATLEKNGYIINPENIPIIIKNPIKINTPFRVFMKGLSREITGFLLKPDYKLNPSATEIHRMADMKILKAFLTITNKKDDLLPKLAIILTIGCLLYIYKISGDVSAIKESVKILSGG